VEKVAAEIPSPILHRVVARPLDTEGATARLVAMLLEREEFSWIEALGPRPTIVEVLSTLLALLELARRGIISLAQSEVFKSFVIRRERSPDEPSDPPVEAADATQAPYSAH
jgi:chromatin segregation and condensation protein Rec8/ScpA/Scc1 (kleisin family)